MPSKEATKQPRKGKRLSAINSIVYFNFMQIRQDLIDRYWIGEVRLLDDTAGIKRKSRSKRTVADWESFNDQLAFTFHLQTGMKWEPGTRIPDSPNTRASFQQDSGISSERLRELELGNQEFTVSEMMAIAYVGNVDVAYMLTPPAEFLSLEEEFVLERPFIPNTSIVDWILWTSNLRQLPEKGSEDYVTNVAVPSFKHFVVDGRKHRSESEAHYRSRSYFSTISGLSKKDPDAAGIPWEREEFIPGNMPWAPRTKPQKIEAIHQTLFLRTRLRVLISLTSAKRKEKVLTSDFNRIYDYLTRDVKQLLSIFRSL